MGDAPGVIGFIGTVLGDHEVNIAGMFNAREAHGGEALTVYALDEQVPDEAKTALESDGRVIEVRYIELNGTEETTYRRVSSRSQKNDRRSRRGGSAPA